MKILIISGFLGAGKTTFIKEFSQHIKDEFAIFENELGEGVDGDLLQNSLNTEKINIWEMAEGCICCQAKGDLVGSVLTIANTINPEYLLIEPTGVGMLSNIIANLQKIEYERISILDPITIVDGKSYQRYQQEYPEIFRDQVENTSRILISKTEHMDQKERQTIITGLREYNQEAEIVASPYKEKDELWWNDLLQNDFAKKITDLKAEENLPDTFSIGNCAVKNPETLIITLENIIHGYYGNIFRAKGWVKAGNIYLRFDVADGLYSIIGAKDKEGFKVVFIGNRIDRLKLRKIFFEDHKLIKFIRQGEELWQQ